MSAYTTTGADSLWIKSQKVINAGDEVIIDTLKLISFRSLKYIFCAYNKVEDKAKSCEINVIKVNGNISDSISGRLGDGINLALTSEKVSDDFNLKIKNNELFPITAEFAKLILGS